MIPPDIFHKNRDDVSVLRLLDPLMIPPDVFHKNRSLDPLMIPPDVFHKNRSLDPLMIPPDVFHKNRSLDPLMIPPDVFHKNRTVSVLRSVDPLSNSSWGIPHETWRCVSSSFHRPATIQLLRCRHYPRKNHSSVSSSSFTWPAAVRSLTLLVTVFAATGRVRILQYSEIALAVGCWYDGYCLE